MDEKRPAPRAMSPPRSLRRSRPTLTIAFVIAVVYTFWIWQPFNPILDQTMVDITSDDVHTTDRLVPLEAHIMSKCPDAKVNIYPSLCRITNAQYLQDGLELLVLPVMQRVHDKVNFTLSYIGRYVDTQLYSNMRLTLGSIGQLPTTVSTACTALQNAWATSSSSAPANSTPIPRSTSASSCV
jgi:hypothetical protein